MDDEITTDAAEAVDETTTGADEAPVLVDETEVLDPDAVEPEPPKVYGGRYQSIEDFERGHEETTKWGHAQAQRAAELERQVAEYEARLQQTQQGGPNPWASLPSAGLPEFQQEEIAQAAQSDPKGTALWAIENQEHLPGDVVSELMTYWQRRDYAGWQQWQFDQFWQQRSQEFEERLHEQYKPLVNQSLQTINEGTIAAAAKQIPNWNAWAPHIVAYLEGNPAEAQHLQSLALDPDAAVQRLEEIYAWLAYQARRSGTPIVKQAAAGTTSTPVGPPGSEATTVTGNTGETPEPAAEPDEFTKSVQRGLEVLKRGRKTA